MPSPLASLTLSIFLTATSPAYLFASDHPSKTAKPTASQSQDITLEIKQPYCDFSLAYTYFDNPSTKSASDSLPMLKVVTKKDWTAAFETERNALTSDSKKHISFFETPQSAGSDGLSDTGGSILGTVGKEFTTDGLDLRKLVVRTLYGPDALSNACNVTYLLNKSPQPSRDDALFTQSGQPPYSFNYQSDPNSPVNQAPEYYLVNIVRWQRDKATNYSVAADEWYIYNYSDISSFRREIPGLTGAKFHPRILEQNDLRLIGSKRVMLLAIHLAPSAYAHFPASASKKPSDQLGVVAASIGLTPEELREVDLGATDSGWYNAAIKYNLHVSKLEPANVRDFKLLFQAVTGFAIGPVTGVKAAYSMREPITTNEAALRMANRQIDQWKSEQRDVPLRFYQYQDAIDVLSSIINDKDHAMDRYQPLMDQANFALAQAALPSDLSHYQGLYGAGILTNLTALPVTLTSTWTRTCCAANAAQQVGSDKQNAKVRIQQSLDVAQQASISTASPRGSYSYAKEPADTTVPFLQPVVSVSPSAGAGSCKAPADDGKVPPCTGSQTFTDEGLYTWDFSVGVPFSGYKELSYGSTGTVSTMKTIARENAFAFFEYMPWKEDILNPPNLSIPHLMVGLPIAGKVFNKPFFGLGESFNLNKLGLKFIPASFALQFRLYGGLNYTKDFRSTIAPGATATAAQVAASLYPHRVWKGQFGIEFSLRDVGKALFKKSSSDTSATKTAAQ